MSHGRTPLTLVGLALLLLSSGWTGSASASTFIVSSLADTGAGSLRQAIIDANAAAGPDDIVFSTSGIIYLSTALPALTDDGTRIMGETAPNFVTGPDVHLRMNGAGFEGLHIDQADQCHLRGLSLWGFTVGIRITGSSSGGRDNTIGGDVWQHRVIVEYGNRGIFLSGPGCEGNVIQGTFVVANSGNGIHVVNGPKENHIGGDMPSMRNLISLNQGCGVYMGGSTDAVEQNHVINNYIGTDSLGTAAWGNGQDGVHLSGDLCNYNDVSNNVIVDNGGDGVEIDVASDNVVKENRIGVDATGTAPLGNHENGVYLQEWADRNRIGPNNVISANTANGVFIWGENADYNEVIGNTIGLDQTRSVALGNGENGVLFLDGPIRCEVRDNVVSANGLDGVAIKGDGSDGHTVEYNEIGTDGPGATGIGNAGHGIHIWDGSVGNELRENLISANGGNGIYIYGPGTDSHIAERNTIGTDVTGKSPLGNLGIAGIELAGTCKYSTIGPDNLICDHLGMPAYGILIRHDNTSFHAVKGNTIGLEIDQASAIANTCGIGIYDNASFNDIGPENVISGNTVVGIDVYSESIMIFANVIGMNGDLNQPFGNGTGIYLAGFDCQIGGARASGMGNVICANTGWGIQGHVDQLMYVTGTKIWGNQIGETYDGTAYGNGAGGIWLGCPFRKAFIGSRVEDGELSNVIAHNGGPGVHLGRSCPGFTEPRENFILRNDIRQNTGDGILIDNNTIDNRVLYNAITSSGGQGITLTSNGNNMISAPTITAASIYDAQGITNLGGAEDTVQVFYDSADEGRVFIDEVYVSPGNTSWSLTFPSPIPSGVNITATNTGFAFVNWETSEFSNAVAVSGGSGVDSDPGKAPIPVRHEISPARPNPCVRGVRVTFALPEAAACRLTIYDLTGRTVRRLAARPTSGGYTTLTWDGRDDRSVRVPSGTYLMESRVGDTRLRERIVVLR